MSKTPGFIELGQNPLTDPRSLGSSTLFHAVIVVLASLAVIPVALPLGAVHSPQGPVC